MARLFLFARKGPMAWGQGNGFKGEVHWGRVDGQQVLGITCECGAFVPWIPDDEQHTVVCERCWQEYRMRISVSRPTHAK